MVINKQLVQKRAVLLQKRTVAFCNDITLDSLPNNYLHGMHLDCVWQNR